MTDNTAIRASTLTKTEADPTLICGLRWSYGQPSSFVQIHLFTRVTHLLDPFSRDMRFLNYSQVYNWNRRWSVSCSPRVMFWDTSSLSSWFDLHLRNHIRVLRGLQVFAMFLQSIRNLRFAIWPFRHLTKLPFVVPTIGIRNAGAKCVNHIPQCHCISS